MLDPLFVAIGEYARSGLANVSYTPVRTTRSAGANLISAASTPTAAQHNRNAAALLAQIGRLTTAQDAVQAARDAAAQIFSKLSLARSIATTTPVGTTGPAQAASATGTALSFSAIDVTGTVALSDDAAAGGSGTLALSPVSVTGSVSLIDDQIAVATGDQDVASTSNFLVETSISQSQTLTIDTGSGANTIVFGVLTDQVLSASDLEQAINEIDGVSASYTAEGYLSISGNDAETTVTIGGTADISGVFGIAETSYEPINLLSQGLGTGETLTFQVNQETVQTLEFGFGTGQIGTLGELETAVAGITGVDVSVDPSNRLAFSTGNAFDTVTVGGTADIATAFGVSPQLHDPEDLLTQGLSQDETLTFQIGSGSVQTIVFGTGPGEVTTVTELNDALAALSGLTASLDAQHNLNFTVDDAREGVTVGGTGDIAGVLGIAEQTYDPANLLTQGIASGETLTFSVNGGATQTIEFGTGTGEVATLSELNDALDGLTGLTAAIGTGNRLTYAATADADSITVGGTADIDTAFGLTPGTLYGEDLLTLGITQGETLTFKVGTDATQTIVFGTGVGEVRTLSDLNSELAGLSGLTAVIDAGNILSFTAEDTDVDITVGGTADAASVFGIAETVYEPTEATSNASAQESITLLDEAYAAIDEAVYDALIQGVSNPVAGFRNRVSAALDRSISISYGGFDLTREGLGLSGPESDAFASSADVDEIVGQIDAALGTVQFAIARLRTEAAVIDAQLENARSRRNLASDASDALTAAPRNPEQAQELARLARIQLGRQVVESGLNGGLANSDGSHDPQIIGQLLQSAFSSSSGILLAPPGLLSNIST